MIAVRIRREMSTVRGKNNSVWGGMSGKAGVVDKAAAEG